MLRTLLIATVLCCTFIVAVNAQSPFYSMHYVESGEISDEATHITTQDGGNLIASVQHPAMASSYFITLVKTDAGGTIQWTKKFPCDRPGFRNVVQSTDGTYFLCYCQFPFGNYYEAIRLDQNGNVIFDKKINLPSLHRVTWKATSVAKIDSGYYVGCSIYDTTSGVYRWNLMEISASGNVVWTQNFNSNGFLAGMYGMELCNNGDILLLGSAYDIPTLAYVGLITRVDASGTLLWNTRFAYAGHDLYPVDAEKQGNDFIVSVQDMQQSAGMAAVDFIKVDANGSLVWQVRYTNTGPNSSLLPHDMIVSGANEFVVVAQRSGPDLGSVFLKVDATGQYVSSRFYPDYTITSIENYGQWMYSVVGTKDSLNEHYVALKTVDGDGVGCNDTTAAFGFGPVIFTFVTGGSSANFSLSAVNGNLSATTANLVPYTVCTLSGINDESGSTTSISVYPSPATDKIQVVASAHITSVQIVDVNGKVVVVKSVSSNTCDIDVRGLPAGLYVIRVEFENHVESRRLVIAH